MTDDTNSDKLNLAGKITLILYYINFMIIIVSVILVLSTFLGFPFLVLGLIIFFPSLIMLFLIIVLSLYIAPGKIIILFDDKKKETKILLQAALTLFIVYIILCYFLFPKLTFD